MYSDIDWYVWYLLQSWNAYFIHVEYCIYLMLDIENSVDIMLDISELYFPFVRNNIFQHLVQYSAMLGKNII